jgi:oligo-1,6-glucosidase
MMRWWLDRGVDGFRMDVINFISKDTSLPDAHSPTGAPTPTGSSTSSSGPRIHEFLQELHREVFAGREDRCLTVGEMPGVTVEDARLFTDPARGEVDMVFQFEHVQLDHGLDKWDVRPLRLLDLKASLGRWQTGLADVGWNSLYWDNHDQPRVVSRFGDDGAFRVESAKMLATVLHLHRGTPYVYQGEEIGMANFPFTSIEQFRDIESVNHWAHTVGAGRARPEQVLAGLQAMSRDNARTPVQWDDGPAPASRPAPPGWRSTRPRRGERRGAARRPRLGARPLPAAHRPAAPRAGRRRRRLHDAAAAGRAGVRLHAHPRRHVAAGARQLLRRARGGAGPGRRRLGRGRGARRAGSALRAPTPTRSCWRRGRAGPTCGRDAAAAGAGAPPWATSTSRR